MIMEATRATDDGYSEEHSSSFQGITYTEIINDAYNKSSEV